MAAYRRTGVSRVIGRVRNVSALHRDGTVFPISLRVQHIRTGLVDVLRATIERVDSDLEAVFTIDEAGIIESANRNFVLTLFGYTTEELIGKPIGFLVPSLLPRIEEKEKQKQEQRQQQQHHQQQQQQQQEPSAEQQQDTPEQQQRSGQKDEDTDEWRLRVSAQMEVQHKDGSRYAAQPTPSDRSAGLSGSRSERSPPRRFPVHLEVMRFLNEYGQVRYSGRIRRVTTSSEDNATATSSGSDNSAIGSTTSPAASSTPSQELVGEYVLGRVLGRGSYGLVRHATHRSSGRQVAIKLLCKEQLDPRQLEYARREASLLQRLGPHPGLVRLYEVIETPTRLCLVLEYLEGGELQALISRRGALPEDEARRLFEQIARAIHFCHRQGVGTLPLFSFLSFSPLA
jgi:PAS domain-containing protein